MLEADVLGFLVELGHPARLSALRLGKGRQGRLPGVHLPVHRQGERSGCVDLPPIRHRPRGLQDAAHREPGEEEQRHHGTEDKEGKPGAQADVARLAHGSSGDRRKSVMLHTVVCSGTRTHTPAQRIYPAHQRCQDKK